MPKLSKRYYLTTLFTMALTFLSCSTTVIQVPSLPSPTPAPYKIGVVYSLKEMAQIEQAKADKLSTYPSQALEAAFLAQKAELIYFHQNLSSETILKQLETLDALVLPGGQDIDPTLYGEKTDPKLEFHDIKYDQFELLILARALEKNLPIMGICRGFQLINVHFGGTLYQDIPSGANTPLVHRLSKEEVPEKIMATHSVTWVKGSAIQQLLQKESSTINSFHHQGIKTLGKGPVVLAQSEDSIIEAFEKKEGDKGHIFAIQFHPERYYHNQHPDKNSDYPLFFKYFISLIQKK